MFAVWEITQILNTACHWNWGRGKAKSPRLASTEYFISGEQHLNCAATLPPPSQPSISPPSRPLSSFFFCPLLPLPLHSNGSPLQTNMPLKPNKADKWWKVKKKKIDLLNHVSCMYFMTESILLQSGICWTDFLAFLKTRDGESRCEIGAQFEGQTTSKTFENVPSLKSDHKHKS